MLKSIHLVGYNAIADNTGISSFGYRIFIRLAVVVSKSAKSREILRNSNLQQFKVAQGHRSWCQSKAHMRLPISH